MVDRMGKTKERSIHCVSWDNNYASKDMHWCWQLQAAQRLVVYHVCPRC